MVPNAEPLEILQSQMRCVRNQIENDVDEFVASTKQIIDWKSYVRSYPVATTAIAMAVGYLLVPTKTRIVKPDTAGPAQRADRIKSAVPVGFEPPPAKPWTNALVELATTTAIRAIGSLIGQRLSQSALLQCGTVPDGGQSQDTNQTYHHLVEQQT